MRNQDLLANNQLDFIDTLSIASFVIGLMNLGENLTQGDKQELQKDLADKADRLLMELHAHLEQQDVKLDAIAQRLEMIK